MPVTPWSQRLKIFEKNLAVTHLRRASPSTVSQLNWDFESWEKARTKPDNKLKPVLIGVLACGLFGTYVQLLGFVHFKICTLCWKKLPFFQPHKHWESEGSCHSPTLDIPKQLISESRLHMFSLILFLFHLETNTAVNEGRISECICLKQTLYIQMYDFSG